MRLTKFHAVKKIVAFIKSSIILAPLSLGGNIITDCAIYHHPSHDDWAEVNRGTVFRSYVVMLYCKKMIWQKW